MTERNDTLDKILAAAMPDIEAHWESCRSGGLDAHTEANTAKVNAAIHQYFDALRALPDPAADAQILSEMQRLYAELDAINAACEDQLLETDERELLVDVFVEAAVICGIDADQYDGEPGGEFRNF